MQQFQQFMEWMRPHWPALALCFTWTGILLVAVRRRWLWKRKTFLTQVNFSLNYLVGDSLAMRTLIEREAGDVWINDYGVKLVFAAAARTTAEHPFLTFKNPTDQDFVNRAVLNVLSSRFAETFLAASLGVPVLTTTYYFAVTCERFQIMRTIKLRVLLMNEHTMLELFDSPQGTKIIDVNNEVYRARLMSLKAMYDLYLQDRTDPNPVLGKIELGVVVDGPVMAQGARLASSPCATSSSSRA